MRKPLFCRVFRWRETEGDRHGMDSFSAVGLGWGAMDMLRVFLLYRMKFLTVTSGWRFGWISMSA
jgi:hypothetical protein